jgi:hypothetical protein
VYFHLIGEGTPAPFSLIRWQVIDRFHWTPEQFDNISWGDLQELFQVDDGIAKARNFGKGGHG